MTKVLVTGGSGFLARHVVESLAARGFEVHVTGRSGPVPDAPAESRWHPADLFDRFAVAEIIERVRPDGLVHLAWEARPGTYWTAMSLSLLADFRAAGGTRVVLAGTSAEYDWSAPSPFDGQRSALRPASVYGRCKNALREIVEAWAPVAGVSWAWGRIFNIIGPHENPSRLVPRTIRALAAREKLNLDDCSDIRDFLDVRDAADAFATLYASDVPGTINIASGKPVSVRRVIETFSKALGTEELVTFGVGSKPGPSHPEVVTSVARLRDELGWTAKADLADAVQTACRWWIPGHPFNT